MAACFTSAGPSVSGNPCPRLIAPVSSASADISAKIVVPNGCRRSTRYGFTGRSYGTAVPVDEDEDPEHHRDRERTQECDLLGAGHVHREMAGVVHEVR